MNMDLFSNLEEGTNFLNYKARIRIDSLKNICKSNNEDILEYINSCDEIFSRYNKNNLIKDLYQIDLDLNNIDSQNLDENKIKELNHKREVISFEFKKFLEELHSLYDDENLDLTKKTKYLSDREDIEFAYKKIINRSLDIQDKKSTISMIKESYPDAINFNVNEFKNNSITFKLIKDYTKNFAKEESEEEQEPVEPKETYINNDLYVVKISEAPEELKLPDKEESKEETHSENIVTENDTSFFGIDDALTESILNNEVPTFEEVVEEEPTKLEDIPLDVDLVPVTEDSEPNLEEKSSPETKAEEEVAITEATPNEAKEESTTETKKESTTETKEESTTETKKEESSNKQEENTEVKEETIAEPEPAEEQMTYTMDEHDTIHNIALALFEDENLAQIAVHKIIENNKEAIDKKLQEQNITDQSNLENQENVLTGLTLNLSKVFEEVVSSNETK